MSIFDEPKIDTHCHVLDPARFAYADDVAYRPAGQEVAPLEQYEQLMPAYGIRHALFVGPNSGYGLDNRCLLDALARGQGRFKGIAVVRSDASVYVDALIGAFTLDACMWASDWPFLKATPRMDIGPLLSMVERLLPRADDRRRLFWDTPARWLGFD